MSGTTDTHSISQIYTLISAAIVEEVKQASHSNANDFTDDTSTKRKTESGVVGEFIANCRKKTLNKQD